MEFINFLIAAIHFILGKLVKVVQVSKFDTKKIF